jgi:transcriptional regulator with XRE-family HTH domain
MLALGQAIRSFRVRKGLSQKELARLSHITPSFLSQVESEHRTASLTVLSRIARAMGVTPEVLIWEAVELPETMSQDDRKMCEFAKIVVRKVFENEIRAADDQDAISATD